VDNLTFLHWQSEFGNTFCTGECDSDRQDIFLQVILEWLSDYATMHQINRIRQFEYDLSANYQNDMADIRIWLAFDRITLEFGSNQNDLSMLFKLTFATISVDNIKNIGVW
jgi:hypothetical protein